MYTKKEAEKQIKILLEAGIAVALLATEWKSPDREFEPFFISHNPRYNRWRGRLEIDPGGVEFRVFADKKRRQAILWVDEKRRTITRKVELGRTSEPLAKKRLEQLETTGTRFPVSLPVGTDYKILNSKIEQLPTVSFPEYEVSATVQATIPATRQTFLVGRDETSHFVSLLPKRVQTVSEAHEVLRPASVPKGSPRQGEWFFVSATDTQAAKLDEIACDPRGVFPTWLGAAGTGRRRYYVPDDVFHDHEDDTSHAATQGAFLGKDLFVVGYIFDDRSDVGFPPRHKPLWLSDWHKVVRNRELVMDTDGSETWD